MKLKEREKENIWDKLNGLSKVWTILILLGVSVTSLIMVVKQLDPQGLDQLWIFVLGVFQVCGILFCIDKIGGLDTNDR